MSFFNRRVVLFLLVDGLVLLILIGLFTIVNNSLIAHKSTLIIAQISPSPTSIPVTVKTLVSPSPTLLMTPVSTLSAVLSQILPEINLTRLRDNSLKVIQHKVEKGENNWTIAKKNNIDIYTLIGANPSMPVTTSMKETLNILVRKGILYTVEKNDDLEKIAEEFHSDKKSIQQENNITWWHSLKVGDVLFIPNVKPIHMNQEWVDYFNKKSLFGNPLGLSERINSFFGKRVDPITGDIRHHNGVDLHAKYGDPVYAAAKGKVTFTGISGGYGNLIVINNGNGYLTYYGHLSKIYSKMGQKVKRGTLIGRVGATGRVTGPHLHFEIHKNGKAVDPYPYI